MAERYPGYDVLNKRRTPWWNDKTRAVIDERLAINPDVPKFLAERQWETLRALCDRIVPQPAGRARPVPVAAMVDRKLAADGGDGYRNSRLPPLREAWRRGLAALDAEALARWQSVFHALAPAEQDQLLTAVQGGKIESDAWGDMPVALFFSKRVLHDIVSAYYAHPIAWNEIGFGGPASPRGYVRMNFDRRDPWEAVEAQPGREADARRENSRVG